MNDTEDFETLVVGEYLLERHIDDLGKVIRLSANSSTNITREELNSLIDRAYDIFGDRIGKEVSDEYREKIRETFDGDYINSHLPEFALFIQGFISNFGKSERRKRSTPSEIFLEKIRRPGCCHGAWNTRKFPVESRQFSWLDTSPRPPTVHIHLLHESHTDEFGRPIDLTRELHSFARNTGVINEIDRFESGLSRELKAKFDDHVRKLTKRSDPVRADTPYHLNAWQPKTKAQEDRESIKAVQTALAKSELNQGKKLTEQLQRELESISRISQHNNWGKWGPVYSHGHGRVPSRKPKTKSPKETKTDDLYKVETEIPDVRNPKILENWITSIAQTTNKIIDKQIANDMRVHNLSQAMSQQVARQLNVDMDQDWRIYDAMMDMQDSLSIKESAYRSHLNQILQKIEKKDDLDTQKDITGEMNTTLEKIKADVELTKANKNEDIESLKKLQKTTMTDLLGISEVLSKEMSLANLQIKLNQGNIIDVLAALRDLEHLTQVRELQLSMLPRDLIRLAETVEEEKKRNVNYHATFTTLFVAIGIVAMIVAFNHSLERIKRSKQKERGAENGLNNQQMRYQAPTQVNSVDLVTVS